MLGVSRTYQGGNWQSNIAGTPSTGSPATLVTASSTIHTKGAYTQLIASTTYDWQGFWLNASSGASSGAATDILLDIAIGAASSEQIILPNLMVGWSQAMQSGGRGWFIPLTIPRGTRISARTQALISSDTVQVFISGNSGSSGLPCPMFSGCDAYGIDSATSSGTSHTAGNTGVESTDANVGSTTSRNYGAVLIGVASQSATTTSIAYHWELTIGGVTQAEWYTANNTSEVVWGPWPPTPVLVSIPSGTQLQVQAEASGTAQAQDVAFYCFY